MPRSDHPVRGELRAEADRVSELLHGLCAAWEDGTPPATDDLHRVIEDLGRLRTLVEGTVLGAEHRVAGR
ncbi:hypothetical protein [Patulibacter minatonensis]|uniref:hypothetical protein n=1 Tax=Patulibacter minatonensis TaxID=298163 RepID=UPI0012F87178|nr:hypothetical protein [Patulibacter minatonensis]